MDKTVTHKSNILFESLNLGTTSSKNWLVPWLPEIRREPALTREWKKVEGNELLPIR